MSELSLLKKVFKTKSKCDYVDPYSYAILDDVDLIPPPTMDMKNFHCNQGVSIGDAIDAMRDNASRYFDFL